MHKLSFKSNEKPTVGVELELGLVDNDSMALASAVQQLLAALTEDEAASVQA